MSLFSGRGARGSALLLLLVAACPFGATPGPAPAAAAASSEAAVRPGTLHVSPRGRNSAPGTAHAPLRTIGAAIDRARSGDRIVVHAGSYHEELEIPQGKRLQLTSAPHSRVWVEGSRRVGSWRHEGGVYVHSGWRAEFDSSPTYHWGAPDNDEEGWAFVNARHPMAAHPDQMWVSGRAQRQVGSRSAVRPGTFFVDDAADRLYLGTDPRGRSVRASDIAKAISIRGAGSSISGIGVRRFAPSVPHMGAVTVEAPDVALSHMRIEGNATTGLHVTARDATLTDLRLRRNGMLGASATYADGLRATGLRVRHNNTEGFNTSPVAGGLKIGRTRGVLVRDSVFARNAGTGLWFDESAYDVTVLDTAMRHNRGHGLALEISAVALVADTVIAGNAGDGIKVNNTSHVALWNNTIVGNGRPLDIVQDDRDPSDPGTPGRDPRRPQPDPTLSWVNGPVEVHNNIVTAARGANCLLCVEDYSGRFTAEELRVHASGNVYGRRDRSTPSWVVVWSRGSGDPDVFTSVGAFHRATGEEPRPTDLVGVAVVTSTLRPTQRAAARTGAVAAPLDGRVARLLGRRPGERHLGAWFD